MVENRVLIAPSLLSADFARMHEEIRKIERYGGDWVHIDVMDGHFVPNISFGQKMVGDLRGLSRLPFDVHLMTEKPENFIASFAEAGADYITFHPEATIHSHRALDYIRKLGRKAGVSLLPSTPAHFLQELFPFIDLILVMTVNPGYGGQQMIPECREKIRVLSELKKEKGYSYLIAVDGGINRFTAADVVSAGAEILVMGTAFFASQDPAADIAAIRGGKIV